MKGLYARRVRELRAHLCRRGYLIHLDSWSKRSPRGRWVRSLLAIYDAGDLAALDLPWWTLGATKKVADFLTFRQNARVFEWGSGASTVWLARRAADVASVEHDPRWARQIARMLPDNAHVTVVEPKKVGNEGATAASSKRGFEGLEFYRYVSAIEEIADPLDLIVVDGRAREACLVKALERLAPGGLIVLDNVERARYRRAVRQMKNSINVEWCFGVTPCLPYPTGTAIITAKDG